MVRCSAALGGLVLQRAANSAEVRPWVINGMRGGGRRVAGLICHHPNVSSERFDAAYYRRFYGRRPVHDRRTIAQLAAGVMGMARWWRIPIRSVLDVGAGKGYWRDQLAVTHPHVR